MHDILELKKMLCKELEEYGRKGELSTGSLDTVDKLAHTVKNLTKILESDDGEYSNDGYSTRRRYYRDSGTSYDGGSSYARRRDSMGRYARAEDNMDGIIEELHSVMGSLPEEKRKEAERFVRKMESM
jgi:hypothetical protein